MRQFSFLFRMGLVMLLLFVGTAPAVCAQAITTFDPPNSASTFPAAINPAGQITGYYLDRDNVHGFLRQNDGTFTTFNVVKDGVSWPTFATAMNSAGQITGYFCLEHFTCHSFFRKTDGTFTLFLVSQARSDATDDPTSPLAFVGEGDGGNAINPAGWVTGVSGNARYVSYLWQPNGTVITFEVPPEGNSMPDTEAQAINPAGQITGYYLDASGYRGFLRQRDGTIIRFDVPDSSTIPIAINPRGQITGSYGDRSGTHGFLRQRDGTIIRFDGNPTAINPKGQITGSSSGRGFLREPDGTLIVFDIHNSSYTNPTGINPAGLVTGYYQDATGVHGFLREGQKMCPRCAVGLNEHTGR